MDEPSVMESMDTCESNVVNSDNLMSTPIPLEGANTNTALDAVGKSQSGMASGDMLEAEEQETELKPSTQVNEDVDEDVEEDEAGHIHDSVNQQWLENNPSSLMDQSSNEQVNSLSAAVPSGSSVQSDQAGAAGSDVTDRAEQPLGLSRKPLKAIRKPAIKPSQNNVSPSRRPVPKPFSEDEFLQALRHGNPFKDRPDPQQALFDQLEAMFVKQGPGEGKSYEITKITDDLLGYKRRASVYLLGMQNKFFVPVWAAACDWNTKTGYIMTPSKKKLKGLREALKEITDEEDSANKQKKMRELLRMVLAPTALGLDALHCPIRHRRPTFFHRDLCVDNIALPYETFEVNDPMQEESYFENAYGEAKIWFTEHTRCSNDPESVDNLGSLQSNRLEQKYYHHPAPYGASESHLYRKRHDWYSYGVLVLELISEMICMLVTEDRRAEFQPDEGSMKVESNLALAKKLHRMLLSKEERAVYPQDRVPLGEISNLTIISSPTKRHFVKYLEVAIDCLDMGKLNDDLINQYPIRNLEGQEETYYFEYGISTQTARLLEIFDNSVSPSWKSLHDRTRKRIADQLSIPIERVQETCHACMLRSSVKLPTRTYRSGALRRKNKESKYQCDDETCNRFYCQLCYTNHERFFCPIGKHGTTSSRIGHDSSYALILCGDHFAAREGQPTDVFVRDAHNVYNTITHSMTCQIPEENVVLCTLHQGDVGDNPRERFNNAIEEMRQKIHRRERLGATFVTTESCTNDRDYCLLIFYSGHGRSKNASEVIHDGLWAPVKNEDGWLHHKDICEGLNSLSKCEKEECTESCGLVQCIMDHCFTQDIPLARAKRKSRLVPPRVKLYTAPMTESFIDDFQWCSEITDWFCRFLRSHLNCGLQKKSKMTVESDLTHETSKGCGMCEHIEKHIDSKCNGAYLDGETLKSHAAHTKPSRSDLDLHIVKGEEKKIILAHYHPEGVYFNVFPTTDEYSVVPIEFICEINRENIQKAALLKNFDSAVKGYTVVLLTNHGANDSLSYNLVWDSEIRSILELSSRKMNNESPRILQYHIVKEQVKVRLVMKIPAGEQRNGEKRINAELVLNLDDTSMCQLLNALKPNPLTTMKRSPLPNILVHVVHNLFHTHYKHKLTRSTSYNSQSSVQSANGNQPSDSDVHPQTQTVTDQENLWNGFAGMLYDNPRPEANIAMYTEEQWMDLADQASRYDNRSPDQRVFTFEDSTTSDPYYEIIWP